MIDVAWREAVRAACEPVLAAAQVGFEWNDRVGFDDDYPAMVWEADPVVFVARYPDYGIADSCEEGWPESGCIDAWIRVDPVAGTARLSVESRDVTVELTGDGRGDGQTVATWFADALRVTPAQQG